MDLDLIDAAHYEIGHCSSQEVAFQFCCCSLCLLIQWNGGLFQLANMGFFTFSFIAGESKFILWSLGLTLISDYSKMDAFREIEVIVRESFSLNQLNNSDRRISYNFVNLKAKLPLV